MNKLSIIIPVYYNEDTLKDLYADLKAKVLDKIKEYEIIFVNDGSEDHSWEIINEIKEEDENVIGVNLSKNFGEHSALLAGLSICTGTCAVTKQADLQEDSSLIIEMYESWQKGNKVVLAARKAREDSFSTKLFASIYYNLIRKFVTKKMPLGGCDCFLIDKQVIKKLLELNEANSSIILQILWLGFQTDVIYFHRLPRKKGEGKWTLSKKIKLILDSFVSFSYIPIRVMWITGILFCLFAMCMGISILIEFFTHKVPIVGWSSLMCVILISSGLILWTLGILGEYIWRTFDSARKRQPFIIDEVIKTQKKL